MKPMGTPASRRSPRKLLFLAATLLATITIALALAIALGPVVQRERHVRMLRSADRQQRLDGMRYLINHADAPALRRRLATLLARPDADPRTFAAVARAMRAADAWGPSAGAVWLHYLKHRADVGGPNVREAVAIELTRAGLSGAEAMGETLTIELIAGLMDDDAAAVRRLALRAAATLRPPDADPLIRDAMDDPERSIAYEAHLLAGWNGEIDPMRTTAEDRAGGVPTAEQLAAMPVDVAMAATWAATRKLPPTAAPSIKRRIASALKTAEAERVGPLDAFIPYLLRTPTRPPPGEQPASAHQAIEPHADQLAAMIAGDETGETAASSFAVLKRWRAVLSLPIGDGATQTERLQRLGAFHREADDDKLGDLLAAAAASRLAPRLDHDVARRTLQPIGWTDQPNRFWRELAALENAPIGSVEIEVKPEMPPVFRAAAVRAARAPDDWDWLNAFDADEASVRHMAAFAAMDRLAPERLDALIEQLLRSSYRQEVLGGAVLAGLTGRRAELVRRQLKRADHWLVALHLKLALYMMGEPVEFKPKTLLVRRDFPAHTVYLALMHTGDKAGFDRFFTPIEPEAPRAWRDELDRRRYWHTLRRYLPDRAPPFWLWADRALQRFQIDALRAWYITRRSAMTFDREAKRFVLPLKVSHEP